MGRKKSKTKTDKSQLCTRPATTKKPDKVRNQNQANAEFSAKIVTTKEQIKKGNKEITSRNEGGSKLNQNIEPKGAASRLGATV